MIERYSITASQEQLAKRFSVDVPDLYRSRYNAAPAQLLPVILLYSKGVSFFYWGEVPKWAKNKSISEKWINVRAEQVSERPILQKALKANRCLIPADGFYAWKKAGKKTQIPYRFTLKSKAVFSIPGLWEEYDDENGEVFHTFTFITAQANDAANSLSERIPVIFDPQKEKIWMNTNTPVGELIPLLTSNGTESLDYYTVDPGIFTTQADERSMILPSASADQFGNLTLFD